MKCLCMPSVGSLIRAPKLKKAAIISQLASRQIIIIFHTFIVLITTVAENKNADAFLLNCVSQNPTSRRRNGEENTLNSQHQCMLLPTVIIIIVFNEFYPLLCKHFVIRRTPRAPIAEQVYWIALGNRTQMSFWQLLILKMQSLEGANVHYIRLNYSRAWTVISLSFLNTQRKMREGSCLLQVKAS